MLPARLSPTGTYARPERVSVHALGFRILCVAEIEHYLEDRCVQIAKTALDAWKTKGHFSPSLQSLTVFTTIKYESPPAYLTPKPKDQKDWDNLVSPIKRIERAVNDYLDFVREENHGIREKNLLALLVPIGIDLRRIDQTLLDRMDALGSKRGDAAHNSCAKAVRSGVDPAVEKKSIDEVVAGILDLDSRLEALLSAAS